MKKKEEIMELLKLILVFLTLWGGLNFLTRHISLWASKPVRQQTSWRVALLLTLILGMASTGTASLKFWEFFFNLALNN